MPDIPLSCDLQLQPNGETLKKQKSIWGVVETDFLALPILKTGTLKHTRSETAF